MEGHQVKVEHTEEHSDSQKTHTVCRGTLKLIRYNKTSPYNPRHIVIRLGNLATTPSLTPIIVIPVKKLSIGDIAYDKVFDQLFKVETQMDIKVDEFSKAIVMPDRFSMAHIESIMNGKLNDGDEVLVKCHSYDPTLLSADYPGPVYNVWCPLKLFPVIQSWEAIFEKMKGDGSLPDYRGWNTLANLLAKHYHPPKRK